MFTVVGYSMSVRVGYLSILFLVIYNNPAPAQSSPPRAIELAVSSDNRTDYTYLHFVDTASFDFDISDATKRFNEIFNLYSLSADGHQLAINGISGFACEFEIPLRLSDTWMGEYEFNWNVMNSSITEIYDIYLGDNYTGEEYTVSETGGFAFSIFDDPESALTDRFSFYFETKTIEVGIETEVSQDCGNLLGSVTIKDSRENILYSLFSGDNLISSMEGNGSDIVINELVPALMDFRLETSRHWCQEYSSSQGVDTDFVITPQIVFDNMKDELRNATGQKGWWYAEDILLNPDPVDRIMVNMSATHTLKVSNDHCEVFSEPFVVTALENSSIDLEIRPNPTTDFVQINSTLDLSRADIRVVDLKGNITRTRSVNSSIDLRSLSPGIYFLTISQDSKQVSTRIVKN